MVRILMVVIAIVFSFSSTTEAGWLGDKLKQAADTVGDRIIKDTTENAYEGAEDSVTPQNDSASKPAVQYESQEVEEYNQQAEEYDQAEDSEEGSAEYEMKEMEEPAWGGYYHQKPKKKKKSVPPRTDLHLTADMIMSDPGSGIESIKGKIYIDGVKLRSEFDYPDGNSAGMIVTGIKPTDKVYLLMHREKQYIESSYDATEETISLGSDKPCDEFRKAEKLGNTKLNGRNVTQWRCSEPEDPEMYEGSSMTLWFDDKLNIPIRMEEAEGKSWELQNIREGKPSGDVFIVPSDYKKLTGGAIPTATSLSENDKALIEHAGIPPYPKARFVYGNSSVGYRFASSESVETVKNWYRKQLPSWPVYEDNYGSWIIYNGKPGADMARLIMQKTQVSIQKNDKLPDWHSLDKDMTTEIVIFIVQ